MRRILFAVLCACAVGNLFVGAQQPPSTPPVAGQPQSKAQVAAAGAVKTTPVKPPVPFTLSIDNIMRGPKLVGNAPSAIRWAQDSSKLYFSWQKFTEDRANTYAVNRDGTDLKVLSQEEARQVTAGITGRADRTRKRLLTAEGGNIVIYDMLTHARRLLIKTAAAESSPRWARGDSAITFMRDGNLFLMTLDGSGSAPAEVQLTDVVAPAGEAAASASAGGRGATGGSGLTGGRGAAGQGGRGGGDQTLTESQRRMRDEELKLIEYLKRQADLRQQSGRGGMGGGRGGRGGAGGPGGGPADSIARFQLAARQSVTDMILSADENYVFIGVTERPEVAARNQDVPNYVTESAYPEMINGRSNVGDSQSRRLLAILDLKQNKVAWADGSAFAGSERTIKPAEAVKPTDAAKAGDAPKSAEAAKPADVAKAGDAPKSAETAKPTDVAKAGDAPKSAEAAKPTDATKANAGPRILDWGVPDCSDDGSRCVTAVRARDNKDRWLVTIDPATGKATAIDNLHDNAWIREGSVATATGGGGFGGGGGAGLAWLPDNARVIFMAEKDGWMHLYSLDVTAAPPVAKPLTSGKWEVASARLSNDRSRIFFASSEVHPGERHFYTMSVNGGAPTRITTATGGHDVTVSPDEKSLAVVYSSSTKPPELFVMPFAAGAQPKQVTTSPTQDFLSFKWIDPKIVTYKARDGAIVYARLYTPEMIGAKRDPKHLAVVFVHGAGYLQFVTKAWPSSYYREHLFHNLLASRGYVVICPDYRASAGYGRDWRTGIYEHMGGKDLEDSVDAARFVVATEKVDAKRIGIYGGSYGGFLTLMAMFTTPDVFAAGAALRPVTDWAHYNHSYTAPILNLPQTSVEAYKRSSPIYFAEGLKGQLLICHGMVDTNVFFQDTVRLTERLIELRKTTWSVAPYPVENHGFTEETSWADEYKRIFKLFEDYLRR
ncbi:MAG: prolyl oligopeptidase family serine peptidase [Acidobacteria bacterium]|nr:prolyl oligopeptidase family serine peptidase [Acidobacteriota bacterium]